MKTLDHQILEHVAGGGNTTKTYDKGVGTALSTLQASITSLSSQKQNTSSTDSLLPIVLLMAFRPQAPTVVAGAACAAPVAAGPVINVATRVGWRRW